MVNSPQASALTRPCPATLTYFSLFPAPAEAQPTLAYHFWSWAHNCCVVSAQVPMHTPQNKYSGVSWCWCVDVAVNSAAAFLCLTDCINHAGRNSWLLCCHHPAAVQLPHFVSVQFLCPEGGGGLCGPQHYCCGHYAAGAAVVSADASLTGKYTVHSMHSPGATANPQLRMDWEC